MGVGREIAEMEIGDGAVGGLEVTTVSVNDRYERTWAIFYIINSLRLLNYSINE